MNNDIIFATVKISGVLGKIAPEIKVTIPQSVLFSIAYNAAKKAVHDDMKKTFRYMSNWNGKEATKE